MDLAICIHLPGKIYYKLQYNFWQYRRHICRTISGRLYPENKNGKDENEFKNWSVHWFRMFGEKYHFYWLRKFGLGQIRSQKALRIIVFGIIFMMKNHYVKWMGNLLFNPGLWYIDIISILKTITIDRLSIEKKYRPIFIVDRKISRISKISIKYR